MSLQKTKLNTLGSITAERHHNSIGSQPDGGGGNRTPRTPYRSTPMSSLASEQQVYVAGKNSKVEYTYGWYSTSVRNK
jgi:hypothetical protein